MPTEMLFTNPLFLATIRPTVDFFDWSQNMASQAEVTIKVVLSVAILAVAGWFSLKSKFRVGALIGIWAAAVLAGWILLGSGLTFGKDTVDDTVNAAAVVSMSSTRL